MITIVGGSGFVGSRLLSILEIELCFNLDKSKSKKYNNITQIGDIRNRKEIKFSSNTNIIILLAAEHKDNIEPKSLYYDVNVSGTKNVLDEMDKCGINELIFTSSVAVYGLNKSNPGENHVTDPFNHYGKSKLEAEKVIYDWYLKKPQKRKVLIIRPTVIFGEDNRGNVYNLLKVISSGKFIMVGEGLNKKSMAYVGNVTAFIKEKIYSMDNGFNIFNYSDVPDFNMKELIKLIRSEMNISNLHFSIPYSLGIVIGYFFDILGFILRKKLPFSSVRVKKFCAKTQYDSSKAHTIFKPPFSIQDSLRKTINYEFKKKQ